MLHSVNPLAAILTSIGVSVYTFAMLLVESVIALIFAAVLPYILTVAMHNTILEATLKISTISPLETASSTHLIVFPVPSVSRSVCPEVYPLAFFDTVFEKAVVIAAIGPDFNASTVLLVLQCSIRC